MKVLLFWSSGKDSAWTLYQLQKERYPVAALLTTTRPDRIVPFHNVPVSWVRRQAVAASLPLWEVPLPFPTPNAYYEKVILEVLKQAKQQGFTAVAFGDLYLADIRKYREELVRQAGLEPLFPIWIEDSKRSYETAKKMLAAGIKAIVTEVDRNLIPFHPLPQPYDEKWIENLPTEIDPCGERGEFHTFCYGGPMFREELSIPLELSPHEA